MYGIRDIIVLTILIGSVPFCFFRPFYGVLLWAVISFLNPQSLSWGAAQTFPAALVVGIPTVAGALFFTNMWRQLRSREVVFLLVLWTWFTLTTLNASFQPTFADHVDAAWYRWQFVSKILLMTIVTIGVVNSWSRLRWLVLAIAGSFGFFTLKAIPWMIITGGESRMYGPGNSMLADNNDFGLALNMTLPLFFFLAKSETDKRLKWLMAVLVVVTVPCILLTYSRGALVGLTVVLVWMIIRSRQRLPLILVLTVAGIFGLFLAPEKWRQRMDFAEEGTLIDDSARSRFNSWTYSFNLALDYPIMGGGFEAYTPTLFQKYAPNPLDVHGPHSIYFGVLAEHGFTGLVLYLSLIGSCFLSLFQVNRRARFLEPDKRANYSNYSTMLQMALVGFLSSGAFLGRAYFDYFFTLVACTAILSRLCLLEWQEAVSVPEEEEQQMVLSNAEDLPVLGTVRRTREA
jgi:probable O-glycosylation ligase (exosortase A-associated)